MSMNVPGHPKLDRPRPRGKTSMTLAYSISVYLRRNRVLMPCELSESSSPDQEGSIQPSFSSNHIDPVLTFGREDSERSSRQV